VSDLIAKPETGLDLKAQGAKQAALLARSKVGPAAVDPKRRKIALVVAGLADLIQMGGFAIFGEGILSVPDDILDGVVALLLVFILGFRWRLLFTLGLELVPFATLFPSWTAVVMSLPTAQIAEPGDKALPPPAA
jgi:hypothetical protein